MTDSNCCQYHALCRFSIVRQLDNPEISNIVDIIFSLVKINAEVQFLFSQEWSAIIVIIKKKNYTQLEDSYQNFSYLNI